ncbi:site-2 protease family protein [Metasolibacillus meyeri]|uniref:site-2 protease family protein n=1 Tax=Metasolibacillus meyeri TaxID=1071052 RepID=UPI000D30142F|nr:site-2 protease family protein [Metasolibacillus meyeri]
MAANGIENILCILYIPLIVIIHELGHAAFIILFGREVTEISLGVGEVIFRIKKFVIKKNSWWLGYCAWENIDSLATYKKLLIYLGGIIFNLSTATIIWIFGDVQYADWYRAFIFSSYVMALINIIPFKFPSSGLESDGLACIQLLRSAKKDD